MNQRLLSAAFSALLLTMPILPTLGDVEGEDRTLPDTVHYQVVDLVTPRPGPSSACPEGQAEDDAPCFVSGVVDEIFMRPNRITVVLGGLDFHYLLGSQARWENGQPLGLLMASKLNHIPVRLRFENWGGVFYLTQVSL